MKDSVIVLPGDSWKARRKMLTPSFHFAIMEGFETCMIKHAMILIDMVYRDSNILILDAVRAVMLMTIMETSFGKEYNHPGECKPFLDNVDSALNLLSIRAISFCARKKWDWFYYNCFQDGKTVVNNVKVLKSIMSELIKDRRKDMELGRTKLYKGRRSFLDHLVHEQAKNNNIILAGHETSSASVAWTLYYLCKHPAVQQKLYEEITDHLSGKNFEDVNVADLKYLTMVVKESLRIQPPAGFLGRNLLNHLKLKVSFYQLELKLM